MRTYRVKSGDTLGSIAKNLLGSAGKWRLIAEVNEIADPNRVAVGQVLKIPPRATQPAPAVLNPPPAPVSGTEVRFVQEGKKFFAIASGSGEKIFLGTQFRRGLFRTGNHEPDDFLEASQALVRELGLTQSEIGVMAGTADNEGNLDAINTWDANYLSFGMFQWTAGQTDQEGELPALLQRIRRQDRALFNHYWGRFGLGVVGVSGAYGHFTLNGTKLTTKNQKQKLRDLTWVLRFVRAGSDTHVQAIEVLHAISRLDQFYFQKQSRLGGHSLSELLTSEYAVALLLDNHVNRPAYVVPCVKKGIEAAGTTPLALRQGDPALERKVLRRYLEARETHGGSPMTNAADRAKVTRRFVTNGRISEARASFRSGRADRRGR